MKQSLHVGAVFHVKRRKSNGEQVQPNASRMKVIFFRNLGNRSCQTVKSIRHSILTCGKQLNYIFFCKTLNFIYKHIRTIQNYKFI